MNIFKNQKIIGVLAVATIVVMVVIWYVTTGLLAVLEQKREAIYTLLAEMRREEIRFSSIETLRRQVQETREGNTDWELAILNPDEKVQYIAFLESAATKSGATMTLEANREHPTSFGNSGSKKEEEISYGDGITTFDLSAIVSGSYAQIRAFLFLVENAPMVIHIREIAISKEKDESNRQIPIGSGIFDSGEVSNRVEESSLSDADSQERLQATLLIRSFVSEPKNGEE
jgi:Tfp pilus assembly protein PilO